MAIQGDRVMFEVAEGTCVFGSGQMRVPTGPFVLAMMAKVKILPVFIVRAGYRRYRVVCKEPFEAKRTSRDHNADVARSMDHWAEVLGAVVREHWEQWFVFEHAFVENNVDS